MTASDDAFTLLQNANPVSDPAGLTLPPIQELVPQAWSERPQNRSGRRRRLLWIVPVVVVGSSAVAAAALVSQRATNPLDVACYAAADLGADTVIVRADERQDAVRTCRDLWNEGELGPGRNLELHSCVLPDGGVGVFPGQQNPCEGLQRPNTSPQTSDSSSPPTSRVPDDPAAVIRLRDDLVERVRRAGCLGPADGRHEAERQLHRHGLTGWTIEVGPGETGAGFDQRRPCVSYSVDPNRQVVILVPSPREL